MQDEEYRKHFELEEGFWWFAGRRRIIAALLELLPGPRTPLEVLDVGCGTGYNLIFLRRFGTTVGCDLSPQALSFCRRRGLKSVARGRAEALPFPDESFDLVTLLDVLYHRDVKSDPKALTEAKRVLKKGGLFLVTDSAFNILRSRHDAAFHGKERFTKRTLGRLLRQSGLSPVRMSYFNFFVFPGVAAVRLVQKLWPGRDQRLESNLKPVAGWANALLQWLLGREACLLRAVDLPFGSSIIGLARKPSGLRPRRAISRSA